MTLTFASLTLWVWLPFDRDIFPWSWGSPAWEEKGLIAISFQPPGQLISEADHRRLTLPSLWVLAERDETADGTRTSERLRLKQILPEVNLEVIPDSNHMDLADLGPNLKATERLLEVTTAFLGGIESPKRE